jgi:hypothetical protein
MKRSILVAALAALMAAPAAGQDFQMRVDRSMNASDPDDVADVTINEMGDAFQVVTGPAAIIWKDSDTASGSYTLSGTFTLQEPSGHNNYYGLFYGGGALDGERQNYLYFLIGQNGTYIVKHRAGNETVHDIQGRTPHDAIRTPGDDGTSVNDLEVRVGSDQTEFVINGTVVYTAPKEGMAGRTDGTYGVRINHVIPGVLVEGLRVSQ